jgi:hypothetical protein
MNMTITIGMRVQKAIEDFSDLAWSGLAVCGVLYLILAVLANFLLL